MTSPASTPQLYQYFFDGRTSLTDFVLPGQENAEPHGPGIKIGDGTHDCDRYCWRPDWLVVLMLVAFVSPGLLNGLLRAAGDLPVGSGGILDRATGGDLFAAH